MKSINNLIISNIAFIAILTSALPDCISSIVPEKSINLNTLANQFRISIPELIAINPDYFRLQLYKFSAISSNFIPLCIERKIPPALPNGTCETVTTNDDELNSCLKVISRAGLRRFQLISLNRNLDCNVKLNPGQILCVSEGKHPFKSQSDNKNRNELSTSYNRDGTQPESSTTHSFPLSQTNNNMWETTIQAHTTPLFMPSSSLTNQASLYNHHGVGHDQTSSSSSINQPEVTHRQDFPLSRNDPIPGFSSSPTDDMNHVTDFNVDTEDFIENILNGISATSSKSTDNNVSVPSSLPIHIDQSKMINTLVSPSLDVMDFTTESNFDTPTNSLIHHDSRSPNSIINQINNQELEETVLRVPPRWMRESFTTPKSIINHMPNAINAFVPSTMKIHPFNSLSGLVQDNQMMCNNRPLYIGYMGRWIGIKTINDVLPPEINICQYTHIHFTGTFTSISENHTLKLNSNRESQYFKDLINKIKRQSCLCPPKLILSVNLRDSNLPDVHPRVLRILENKSYHKDFLNSIISVIRKLSVDGIDFMWAHPFIAEASINKHHGELFVNLLKELHDYLRIVQSLPHSYPQHITSVSLPTDGLSNVDRSHVTKIHSYVDYFVTPTYIMHKSREYKHPYPTMLTFSYLDNLGESVQKILDSGVSKEKLVLAELSDLSENMTLLSNQVKTMGLRGSATWHIDVNKKDQWITHATDNTLGKRKRD